MNTFSHRLSEIYDLLLQAYGPQKWWPAESPFEVMVGAVLTQNTNWQGVEKAIANLKGSNLLKPDKLQALSTEELAGLIKPAGYFNLKARRLQNLIEFLTETYAGDLETMDQVETGQLRKELLKINGVGPETADSILLYALQRPVFVVDTYTYRVMNRHGLIGEEVSYDELQGLFTQHLPLDKTLFNQYHALLVRVGKLHCQPKPRCQGCPLEPLLP
ncbi:MAG: endonuclease III domain-containing protein [Deltaproteobacteria bacterium]|nr:endonuclease III domain-containing protein [Deltaproteobacteria bacterium]